MELSSELIIQAVKWLGSAALAVGAAVESWRIYNKRKEVEAKEKSIGQTALDAQKTRIDQLEKEKEALKVRVNELAYRDENIKEITQKLELNYTKLMNRLIDSFGANRQ